MTVPATVSPTASATSTVRPRRRIGELLVDAGVIVASQLETAIAARAGAGSRERLGETILRLGLASETAIAVALAEQLRLDVFRDQALRLDEGMRGVIPGSLAERARVVPLRWDPEGVLVLACADPTDVVALDDVRLAARARRLRPVVAPASMVSGALRSAYAIDRRAEALIDAIDRDDTPATVDPSELEAVTDDAPVIRLAQSIINDALVARASDIHVEPARAETIVRYRTDGVLHQVMTVPRAVAGPLISRLKLMAGMDIAERRRPQDGRARVTGGGGEVDLRVSSLAALNGETIVIRLLRKGAERLSITGVGLSDAQRDRVVPIVERPQGLVLITGPTGSGKTSTLYALLAHLARETCNVVTIEDPIEYELPGVNQTQVNDRVGLTFATALRTILRQDPDVVMVGEIRDAETAELALQASLTGHLVLSTLHTNDAPSAIVRLRDLGVPPYLVASSLSLVLAQRLVRSLCAACAGVATPDAALIDGLHLSPEAVAAGAFRRGAGCSTCNGTGYRGRTGVFEVLGVDATLRDLVVAGAPESALRSAARRAGMSSLCEDGLVKAGRGVTTLEEVRRVTPVADIVAAATCPVCAQHVEEDFRHCPWCATELRSEHCGGCERRLEAGWRVCAGCGAPTGLPQLAAATV